MLPNINPESDEAATYSPACTEVIQIQKLFDILESIKFNGECCGKTA